MATSSSTTTGPPPSDGAPSTRRRIVVIVATFLVVVLGAELCVRALEDGLPPPARHYRIDADLALDKAERAGRRADGPLVVAAGTSMVIHGFDTATFEQLTGTPAVNVGIPGASTRVQEPWLLDEIEPAARPDLVIWGISSFELHAGELQETVRDRYERSPARATTRLASVDRWLTERSALVRARTVLTNPHSWPGVLHQDQRAEFVHSVEPLGRADVQDAARIIRDEMLADFDVGADEARALGATLDELERRGVEVVLVQMPVPQRYIDLHPRGTADYQQALDQVAATAASRGALLIDLHDAMADEDFADFTHLLEPASIRFTALLAERLEAEGVL